MIFNSIQYSTSWGRTWKAMDQRNLEQVDAFFARSPFGFPHFAACGDFPLKRYIYFRIMLKELNENYSFCLIDQLHGQELWSAATKRQFTDIEFLVDGETYPAHQAIVAARSPYFAKLFSSEKKIELRKFKIDNCAPCNFEQLLFFI